MATFTWINGSGMKRGNSTWKHEATVCSASPLTPLKMISSMPCPPSLNTSILISLPLHRRTNVRLIEEQGRWRGGRGVRPNDPVHRPARDPVRLYPDRCDNSEFHPDTSCAGRAGGGRGESATAAGVCQG